VDVQHVGRLDAEAVELSRYDRRVPSALKSKTGSSGVGSAHHPPRRPVGLARHEEPADLRRQRVVGPVPAGERGTGATLGAAGP